MRIVVTGGKGKLGAEVVRKLEARGATVASASRRTDVDLATGAGLEGALEGAECVVHAATHPLRHRRVDLDGTRRMSTSLPAGPRPHT
jgi:nucleoside-diphosphate-sugar epimerase